MENFVERMNEIEDPEKEAMRLKRLRKTVKTEDMNYDERGLVTQIGRTGTYRSVTDFAETEGGEKDARSATR
jgi:hypothetical protein